MLTRFVEVVFACLFLLQWCNDHIVWLLRSVELVACSVRKEHRHMVPEKSCVDKSKADHFVSEEKMEILLNSNIQRDFLLFFLK